MISRALPCICIAAALLPSVALARTLVVRSKPLHLRSGEQREWSSFPARAKGSSASLAFRSPSANDVEYSLTLRQLDVKSAAWVVTLNDQKLGALIADERDMRQVLPIPMGALRAGVNTLRIAGGGGRSSDDIRIRDVRVEPLPVADLLRQATVEVRVTDGGRPLPVRITVVDASGSLAPLARLRTGGLEAVRTGVVYTGDGQTRIGLPAGEYRIYASRGFDYSAPSERVKLRAGETASVELDIRREVPMAGFLSCDTHVHTLELSGHGDASVDERILTAAGEGLDLIVATEHNRAVDYSAALRKLGLDNWLFTIPGSEVTTATGHFNVFPLALDVPHPDFRERDWSKLMDGMKVKGARVVIQNHPRDLHLKYRPFDPSHHMSSTGENRAGRPFRANAMEVVNSGAMSSNPLQLVRDWLGLLTRGLAVAAIGASDTHTVDFVPIGQARTYIDVRTITGDWRAQTDLALQQLAQGRNLASYGLAADLRQTGEPVKKGDGITVPVELTVWGPSWSEAGHVSVYSNGVEVWRRKLSGNGGKPGTKFSGHVDIPVPPHDTALVAVATGPAILEPFWEVRKPYQPMSPEWKPLVLGVSRAVWIDTDGSGNLEAPLAHAERLVQKRGTDVAALASELDHYDASVTAHAVGLLPLRGLDPASAEVRKAFERGGRLRDAYHVALRELALAASGVN
jgi:hypothetical protein